MERCDEMRFISWNIDSLNAALTGSSARAALSRAVLDTIQEANADVIAIQETKLSATGPTAKHREALADLFPDYTYAWVSSQEPARKGYAGNMVLYKETLSPKVSYPAIGAPAPMDLEGRLITLEFEDFYFNQVYTPNAGNGLVRLSERQVWDEKYAAYLSDLDQEKPVIATGDFNVAHREIDLANPAANRRSPGFTDEEREGFSALLDQGFIDSFRHLHGDVTGAYTWWAQRVKTSKINNSGWRIDYFLVSDRLKQQIIASEMISSGDRQDHTPILLDIRQ